MKRRWLILLLSFNIFVSGASAVAEENEYAETTVAYGMEESFDTVSGMYFEKISQEAEFIASVPNGAVVSDGVYFDVPSNIAVDLEKDGASVSFANKTAVCGQGYYIMKLTSNTGTGVFTFRITAPPTGKVISGEYKYPKVSCSASITSDSQTGLYKYTMPNYKAFYTTVQQYGQSVESAKFVIPRNLGYSLKINGKDVSLVNNKVYSTSGNYTLRIFSNSYADGGGYEATYETVLDFKIPQPQVEEDTSSYSSYSAPVFSAEDLTVTEPTTEETTSVTEDSLLESYYDTVGVYGESFSNGDAFYTNTSNSAIVGGNVYIDMPSNMSVEMTKDGMPYRFEDKTYMNEEGSYILIVTDRADETVSRASYSFRIQKGVESAKLMNQQSTADDNTFGATENGSNNSRLELVDNYDEDRSMYVFNCGNEEFYCSVPDGMFTSGGVMLDIPDSLNAQLFKDGEQVDFAYDVSADGRYTVKVKSETDEKEISFDIASYTVNYFDEFTAPEGYNIINVDYNDFMGVYDDATDELLEEYESGLVEIDSEKISVSNSFPLPIDGMYSFVLQGAVGMPMLSVDVMVDRKAPQVIFDGLNDDMTTEEKTVTVTCNDPEAVLMLTDSNGEEQEIVLTDGSAEIEGTGKYTLTATDGAGNVNTYEFALETKGGGNVLVWIMLLIIAMFALFVALVIFIGKKFLLGDSTEKKKKEKKEKKSNKEKKNKEKKNKENKVKEEVQAQPEADDWENTDVSESVAADYDETDDDWEES